MLLLPDGRDTALAKKELCSIPTACNKAVGTPSHVRYLGTAPSCGE